MPSHASLHVQVWYNNAQIWAGTPRCANLGTTWCSCMFHKTLCQGLRYGSAPLGNTVQSGGYHTSEMLSAEDTNWEAAIKLGQLLDIDVHILPA